MRKIYFILITIVIFFILTCIGVGSYLKYFLPDIKTDESIQVTSTAERVERGKYLANHVTVCMDCHSTRDWSQFSGPPIGALGGGGEKFGKEMGFPGSIYARNITPFGIGKWTDAALFRAIVSGVNKEGKALFPVMPYMHYGTMDKEDIYSIIAYIRSLPSVEKENPNRTLDFPVSLLVNTMPIPSNLTTRPDTNDLLAYGSYLVNAASCVDCHSKTQKGVIISGTEFGGGMEFAQPAGIIRSPNITPDAETGIGNWTEDAFVSRFKQYTDSSYQSPKLGIDDINSPMPWIMYAGMTTQDLKAVYAYLKSLKPINNEVVRITKK